MATVNINYSQSVADLAYQLGLRSGADDITDIGSLVAMFSAATQLPTLLSGAGVGGEMRGAQLHFAAPGNVATIDYTGMAGRTAGGLIFEQPNVLRLEETGSFNLQYTAVGASVKLQAVSGTATSGSVQMMLPAGATEYDPLLGNVWLGFKGAITTDTAGRISGNVTQLIATADKLILRAIVEGNFAVSGNNGVQNGTEGAATAAGELTRYSLAYQDGSVESIEGVSVRVDSAATIDLIENAAAFGGDDVFNVRMPALLRESWTIEAGTGNDSISLQGGGGKLHVNAGSGNDVITLLGDSHTVNGGEGIDTVVLGGLRADWSARGTGVPSSFVHRSGAVETLQQVERVKFSDGAVAFDIDGYAGQAYRIYKAAFDRAPDLGGMGYYLDAMDHGRSLVQVAAGFLASPEYAQRYGANVSDAAFITNLYHNVLHREPEQGGFDYYTALIAGGTSRAQILAGFSESPENQAQVIGAIQNGIDYVAI